MIHQPQSSSSSTNGPQQQPPPLLPPNRHSIPYLGQLRNNSNGSNGSFNELTTTSIDLLQSPTSQQQQQQSSIMMMMMNENNNNNNNNSNLNNKNIDEPIMNGSMNGMIKLSSNESSSFDHVDNKDQEIKLLEQQPTTSVNNNHGDDNDDDNNIPVVYGELVILGYNGCLPQGEKGRRRSKYQLQRRSRANGIKKSKHYTVKQPQTSKAIQDKEQHSISFTLSRSQAIIVEYQHDDDTDMFQIGRSSESPIDFVVIDTLMFEQQQQQMQLQQQQLQNRCLQSVQNGNIMSSSSSSGSSLLQPSIKVAQQSTISRFACRILVDRRPPYCARIYAAGFDSSKNIFLGEKATKWQTNGEIDGLTTNGILIMHPKQSFLDNKWNNNNDCQNDNNDDLEQKSSRYNGGNSGAVWREVSVCGEIYSVRETRSASQKGIRIEQETNVLQDGTLIDLCGATLMWRSSDGLYRSPTKRLLEEMIDQLNASRPQCPVGLNTLVIPRKSISLGSADDKQPYVYLKCGHVQGLHDWGQNKHSNSRTCPMCFKSGPIVRLTMGIEPSFCTSSLMPNFAFNPCGHMASESTVKYWSKVLIPHGTNGFHAMCPFCAQPLQQAELGFVKLIFQ
ncbi:E3 ubiquitin-protein ligase pellino [Dermatophagoides pteronyssinus]|uniref:E3 ubiquitin-protein ligase pellino n=1 Tax=Dermatophagoides pteronyssinus TaxID=6956 RepID=UPI003F67D58E